MYRSLILPLFLSLFSTLAFAQSTVESRVRLSLTYFPFKNARNAQVTLNNGSLTSAMGLAGGEFFCVADADDRIADWRFIHKNSAVSTDVSSKLRIEVLGESLMDSPPTPLSTAPKTQTLLGRVISKQTVRVWFEPKPELLCEFWGSMIVNYNVIQEAGGLSRRWMASSTLAKLYGVWKTSSDGETGAADLTLIFGKSAQAAWTGKIADAPGGTVIVEKTPTSDNSSDVYQTVIWDGSNISIDFWNAVRQWGLDKGYTDLPSLGQGTASVTWLDMFKWLNAACEYRGFWPLHWSRGEPYRQGSRIPYINQNGTPLPPISKDVPNPEKLTTPDTGGPLALFLDDSMVLVSGGSFLPSSALKPLTINAFHIAKTEVTESDWKTVRDWAVDRGYDLAGRGSAAGIEYPKEYPVVDVTWYDTLKWCNAASERAGRIPVYKVGGSVYKTGEQIPVVDSSADGYRLPTEAEWEFAAIGGNKTKKYVYSGGSTPSQVGWFKDNSNGAVNLVARKTANELGIFDMSGNVAEWCFEPGKSSSGSTTSKFRGGDWDDASDLLKITAKFPFGLPLESFNKQTGFRIVRNYTP
jgi:formylglycine-generating enzyme required for sulfatase activity